jgi:hypothetical protein
VLVERHALGGGLAADPVCLLGEDDGAAHARGGKGGGHAAEAGADDEHVGLHLAAWFGGPARSGGCGAGQDGRRGRRGRKKRGGLKE